MHAEVFCLKCKGQGNYKYHCLVYVNYITGEGSIPLKPEAPVGSSVGAVLCHAICQVDG